MNSLGLSLTDTLDDLINEGRIEPQLAMKILSTFDRAITEVLAEKVRSRISFKVCRTYLFLLEGCGACRGGSPVTVQFSHEFEFSFLNVE